MTETETIFALASAPGTGGVAVLRVSGPGSGISLGALSNRPLPAPRRARRERFVDPESGEILDDGLSLWFPGPQSFTGEDVAEYHLHGGRATVAAVMATLAQMPGHRPAEAGEFTRRAYLNGKLDLTAAEGLADLVAAETDAQRRQALRQLDGALGALYEGWRGRLVAALAKLVAAIDFSDEDLPDGLVAGAVAESFEISGEIALHLDDGGRGERLRDGLQVAIAGAPNVGKSSLFNALARRDAAIVAETAGTTRDVVECHLNIGGLPVILADTAGVREARGDLGDDSGGDVEGEGIARAVARAGSSDLVLVLVDARDGFIPAELGAIAAPHHLVVANKIDLAKAPRRPVAGALEISVRTGEGVAALLGEIERRLGGSYGATEAPALTRGRHRRALEACGSHLIRCDSGMELALMAENFRLAVRELGRITGQVGVEDILDAVFRDFCIGK